VIVVSAEGTFTIVTVAGALENPPAEAVTVAVPTPEGVNTLPVMLPLPVATKVGVMAKALPNWSTPAAVKDAV